MLLPGVMVAATGVATTRRQAPAAADRIRRVGPPQPRTARHLRGIQQRGTAASARRELRGEAWRKALLVCGIASSLLYAVMIWAIRYEGYNPVSQVPSELTAIGAPTRTALGAAGADLHAAGRRLWLGHLAFHGRNRTVRVVGGLILTYASLGLLWPFAPMHQREVLAAGGGTLGDTMHVVLGGVTVFLMFLGDRVWRRGIRRSGSASTRSQPSSCSSRSAC